MGISSVYVYVERKEWTQFMSIIQGQKKREREIAFDARSKIYSLLLLSFTFYITGKRRGTKGNIDTHIL